MSSMKDLFGDKGFGQPKPAAAVKRDAAIRKVMQNAPPEWQAKAVEVVRRLPSGWEGIGEAIRREVRREIGPPHDPHAWGGLIMTLRRSGVLVKTGRYAPMTGEKSHARESPVLRRL